MKAYGLPRNDDVANPDAADVRTFALASHIGRFAGKGGDTHSSFRSSAAKRATRRYYKRVARAEGHRQAQDRD